ncbi:MAG: bifunctional 4-hydroxy-2-oxoglutarate aldolase/2-dehydro-3-deoxy-phosphogluconate aldolase [Chloroflexia bacterium]|nr:bifunctional 4-hydroxy-2-oxoglutarate aldolase/2-dehydro-3-deoxy-phosphogluconate aldolase [Chloroflexia bacterium]MDQ3410850.1 bifunctional 4-hydroxy-2-oxoglutarate aldolase/2-dehydro-3-deoxy-phosphogluconate aldolase [Chloroflexota bacterium]
MSKEAEIAAAGVIAIVRLDDLSAAEPLTRALIRAGIGAIEFTFTNRRAAGVIERVREAVGEQIAVGAGSVLDSETGRIAILAGAEFLVTPTLSLPVIELANRYAIPTVIGAFTPTEIVTAWQAGATYVKVFPATAVGPQYLNDVRGPLPRVRLIPTGGVGPDNAAAFIRAGAAAIAVGSSLVDAKTVAGGNWDVIEERARRLLAIVREARAGAA